MPMSLQLPPFRLLFLKANLLIQILTRQKFFQNLNKCFRKQRLATGLSSDRFVHRLEFKLEHNRFCHIQKILQDFFSLYFNLLQEVFYIKRYVTTMFSNAMGTQTNLNL
jgi:hypothetical protein